MKKMEKMDAQTIIKWLKENDDARQEVLEALESDELRRLQQQSRRIIERVRELEMRQAYLERTVQQLQAQQEEALRRLQFTESLVRRLLKDKQPASTDRALGFLVVRKPSTDTTLN